MAKNDKGSKSTGEELVAQAQGSTAIEVYDFGSDAGAGFEGQDDSHLQMAFLVVLQDLSPLCKERKANPGDLLNTVTGEIIPGSVGVQIVPGATARRFVEWVPRKLGGGFRGQHTDKDPIVIDAMAARDADEKAGKEVAFGQLRASNGNDLAETFYVYAATVDATSGLPSGMAVLAFPSTKIKVYKAWNTRTRGFMAPGPRGPQAVPLFANLVTVKTAPEKNSKGEFWNFKLTPAVDDDLRKSLLRPDDPRFKAGKMVNDLVNTGRAKVDYAAQAGHDETSGGGGKDEKPAPF